MTDWRTQGDSTLNDQQCYILSRELLVPMLIGLRLRMGSVDDGASDEFRNTLLWGSFDTWKLRICKKQSTWSEISSAKRTWWNVNQCQPPIQLEFLRPNIAFIAVATCAAKILPRLIGQNLYLFWQYFFHGSKTQVSIKHVSNGSNSLARTAWIPPPFYKKESWDDLSSYTDENMKYSETTYQLVVVNWMIFRICLAQLCDPTSTTVERKVENKFKRLWKECFSAEHCEPFSLCSNSFSLRQVIKVYFPFAFQPCRREATPNIPSKPRAVIVENFWLSEFKQKRGAVNSTEKGQRDYHQISGKWENL